MLKVYARCVMVVSLVLWTTLLQAESFHWVDQAGFHAVDQVEKVPLEHRMELPMVRNQAALPFTQEEDRDGAMFVWFALNKAGQSYSYIKSADMPKSPLFTRIDQPFAGAVGWWKGFAAVAKNSAGVLMTARGEESRASLEKKRGKVTWYRYNAPFPAQEQPVRRAPAKALKQVDEALVRLDKTAEYPLRVKDDNERAALQREWETGVAVAEKLRQSYPDDVQVLRKLGVLHRRGFNLGMPQSWERAEAFLLRTTLLVPSQPDAYISLGILYGDTGASLSRQAESQFRTALKIARKDQLPQIWWGIANALAAQGKTVEALKAVDRLQRLRPHDEQVRKLRITIQEMGRTQQ